MAKQGRPLVFLGTPEPAAYVLEKLIDAQFEIAHVVSRKDARRGRGTKVSESPVKKLAQTHGIEVSENIDWIAQNADRNLLGVVVAYGKLIPASILESTSMINIHFSSFLNINYYLHHLYQIPTLHDAYLIMHTKL